MRMVLVIFLIMIRALGASLPTAEVAVVGSFARGPVDVAVEVNPTTFDTLFGSSQVGLHPAESQVRQFFRNGGSSLAVVRIDSGKSLLAGLTGSLDPAQPAGLGALLPLSDLGLLVCPEITDLTPSGISSCLDVVATLGAGRPLFTLLDPPPGLTTAAAMVTWRQDNLTTDLSHVAIHFPALSVDPAAWSGRTSTARITVGTSGTMAAVFQKNDTTRKIWKSPAGPTTTFLAEGLEPPLTSPELESLNTAGICSVRNLSPYGNVAWGSRTLDSDAEKRYIPVVRTRRWMVRSLERMLSDAALESNGPVLWSNLRTRTEFFLNELFSQGTFAGVRASEAYFVRCDASTTTFADLDAHRVKVVIGASFLRPAEFTVDTLTLDTLDPNRPMPEVPLLVSPAILGEVILSYPTTSGFLHSLQSTGFLTSGTWSPGTELPGDGTWIRQRFPTADPRRFFRVTTAGR